MSVWNDIESIEIQKLGSILKREYPQTIAYILYHVSPQRASDIILHLPENLAVESLMRCWRLVPQPQWKVEMIEEVFADWIEEEGLNTQIAKTNNGDVIKNIIVAAGPNKNRICEALSERNQELKEQIT